MAKKVDHERRKQDIADTAVRMFSQVGYENVSLIMIAAAAGVSRTALYQYFRDKREVMDAAILSVTGRIARACPKNLGERLSANARLEKVCHEVADVMFTHKDFLIAVFDFTIGMVRSREAIGPSINKFTAGTRKVVLHLIEQGKRRGEYDKSLDAKVTADVIYSEFESCAMRIVLGTEKSARLAKQRFSCIMKTLKLSAD